MSLDMGEMHYEEGISQSGIELMNLDKPLVTHIISRVHSASKCLLNTQKMQSRRARSHRQGNHMLDQVTLIPLRDKPPSLRFGKLTSTEEESQF